MIKELRLNKWQAAQRGGASQRNQSQRHRCLQWATGPRASENARIHAARPALELLTARIGIKQLAPYVFQEFYDLSLTLTFLTHFELLWAGQGRGPVSFFCVCVARFPSAIYWGDCPFLVVLTIFKAALGCVLETRSGRLWIWTLNGISYGERGEIYK